MQQRQVIALLDGAVATWPLLRGLLGIVQELEEGVDYAAKRHPSSRTTAGRESASV